MQEESDLDSDEEAAVAVIREKKTIAREDHHVNVKSKMLPRKVRGRAQDMRDETSKHSIKNIKAHLDSVGVESAGIAERGRKRSRSRVRDDDKKENGDAMDEEPSYEGMSENKIKRLKHARAKSEKRDASMARDHSRPRTLEEEGIKDPEHKRLAMKKVHQAQGGWAGGAGEGDNRKSVHLVKWCNTGKKRNGTHYQR